jgi:hypothetical protein
MCAGGAGAYLFAWGQRVWGVVAAALLVGLGFWVQGWQLFQSSGRTVAWRAAMEWWWAQLHWPFGLGLGSYEGLAPFLPMPYGDLLYQLHNDWLQITFELGFVGLGLALALFFHLLWRARHHPYLFSGVVMMGIWMGTYHPLRYWPSQLFIACLIRTVYNSVPRRSTE